MEFQESYLEEGYPFTGRKRDKMTAFLTKNGLTYDEKIEYSVLLCRQDGSLAGCGSRQHNVLKCIAIDDRYQGEGLLQKIMTQLVKQAHHIGISHLFLFTKPSYKTVFSDMGFYPVSQTEDILLLENRKNGINSFLDQEKKKHPSYDGLPSGAIVMNANPFTKGHQYLVETAAAACEVLHVFVLSDDASEFPADVRLSLVRQGCQNSSNVCIHGSSDYLISHATFPDYFLKDKAAANQKAAQLDLQIFGEYFKNAFFITKRFVGEEPFSPITNAYNQQMKLMLPSYGIEVIEIPRKSIGTVTVSATYVRKKFLEGHLEEIKSLVPETTYAYLCSKEGSLLQKKLLENQI